MRIEMKGRKTFFSLLNGKMGYPESQGLLHTDIFCLWLEVKWGLGGSNTCCMSPGASCHV